jgi:hypothetical protein
MNLGIEQNTGLVYEAYGGTYMETIQFLGVCSATSSFAYAARGTRSAVVPLRGNHRSNV